MSVFDFNNRKPIEVASVTGTPTISKTQPLKIIGGDDSIIGTGEIVLDWTNISSKADIGVYDENDNLLDYYFESFDSGSSTAVIWVYRDWAQDGTTQAQIAYGSGPSDQSVVASTVFDKETSLQAGWLLNEDPSGTDPQALDVTSNNNDGTTNGSMTSGDQVAGQVDGAYDFDGSDDYIDCGNNSSLNGITNALTIITWIKPDSLQEVCGDGETPGNYGVAGMVEDYTASSSWSWQLRYGAPTNCSLGFQLNTEAGAKWVDLGYDLSAEEWHHIVTTFDGSSMEIYADGDSKDTNSFTSTTIVTNIANNLLLGNDGWANYFTGTADNFHIYSRGVSTEEAEAFYAATKSTPDFFIQKSKRDIISENINLRF